MHTTLQERGYCRRSGYRYLDRRLAQLCGLGNMAIRQRRDGWHSSEQKIGFLQQAKDLTALRASDRRWKAIDTTVARGALRRVDRAFQAFFRRCKAGEKPGYPRFRGEDRYTTIEIGDVRPSHIRHRADGSVIVRAKGLPRIEVRPTRPIPDDVKMIRITRRPVGCTVDFVVPLEPLHLPESRAAVGIDMGVRKRLTLSTGEIIEPARTDWPENRRRQRDVSRCKRGSRRRRKRVRSLARLRRKQAVRNRNACHRITTRISRGFNAVFVEKLDTQSLLKSGTGRRAINRQIHDQTWGLIRSQLRYKAEWAGRRYVEVDPRYTSRICSVCGTRGDPGSAEQWTCPVCGTRHDRDLNAAINILRAGSLALESTTGSGDPVGSEMLKNN